MEEVNPNAEIFPEQPADQAPEVSEENLKEIQETVSETEPEPENEPVYQPEPEFEPDPLRKDSKEALIIGAVLGLMIGILMFFVPSTAMEEGARLTISVILILLGPRLVQDKYHLDFSKGRFTMAGALLVTLIIYILTGQPGK